MISRGVEISITGGVGEMVRGLYFRFKNLPFTGIVMTLTLVAHHLTLHNFSDS